MTRHWDSDDEDDDDVIAVKEDPDARLPKPERLQKLAKERARAFVRLMTYPRRIELWKILHPGRRHPPLITKIGDDLVAELVAAADVNTEGP